MSFLEVAKIFRRFSQMSARSRMARPESMADATNRGAMMAVCQPSRAMCRPKIHAVTLCTRIATGSAKRETMATLLWSAFFEVMKYR